MTPQFMKFWSYGVGILLMTGLICNGESVSLLSISCLLFLHNIFNILCIFSRPLASVSARHSHGVLHHFLASNIPDAACVVWKIQFSARYCLLSRFSRHLWKLISSVHLLSIEVHSFREVLLSIMHTETRVWLECNFPLLQVSLKLSSLQPKFAFLRPTATFITASCYPQKFRPLKSLIIALAWMLQKIWSPTNSQ